MLLYLYKVFINTTFPRVYLSCKPSAVVLGPCRPLCFVLSNAANPGRFMFDLVCYSALCGRTGKLLLLGSLLDFSSVPETMDWVEWPLSCSSSSLLLMLISIAVSSGVSRLVLGVSLFRVFNLISPTFEAVPDCNQLRTRRGVLKSQSPFFSFFWRSLWMFICSGFMLAWKHACKWPVRYRNICYRNVDRVLKTGRRSRVIYLANLGRLHVITFSKLTSRSPMVQ